MNKLLSMDWSAAKHGKAASIRQHWLAGALLLTLGLVARHYRSCRIGSCLLARRVLSTTEAPRVCTFDSALQPGGFDHKNYPTVAERMAERKQAIPGVSCPLCGHRNVSIMFNPEQNHRESGPCPHCGGVQRFRQIAVAVLHELGQRRAIKALSLSELRHSDEGALLSVWNTQCAGAVHDVLSPLAGYTCSEFVGPETPPGTVVNGTRHEDMQQTSFADNTFDLVISSEVLEHMPAPYLSHQEVLRILRPQGVHVFTVPFLGPLRKDLVRVHMDEAGRLVHMLEPQYHFDPVHPGGTLVFTLFGGQTMLRKLCRMGYEMETHRLHDSSKGILGSGGWVFVGRKPGQNTHGHLVLT